MNRRAFLARVALVDLPAPSEIRFQGDRKVWISFDSTADALRWAALIGMEEAGVSRNPGDGNTYLDCGGLPHRWGGADVHLWACDHAAHVPALTVKDRAALEAMTGDD